MTDERGVRWRAIPLVALVSGVVCWLVLSIWRNAGGEPLLLPWIGLVPLLLLCVVVLVAGWQVRRYARGVTVTGAVRPAVSPQRARGTLVAAQACALGGSALMGWYLANAAMHLPNADVPSVRELLVRALASAVAALALAVCGMVAQSWCRLTEGDDDEERGGPAADPSDLAYG